MAETTENLRHVTSMALYHGGLHVLREPRRFVALVSDELGASASEIRVLYHTVDVGYIELFADAADAGSATALRDATERAVAKLEDEFDMREATARDISLAISLGISDFLGIEEPTAPSGWESQEERQRKSEEEERRRAEEAERQRKAAEAEQRRRAEEAERQRKAAEDARKTADQGTSGTGSSSTDDKATSGNRSSKVVVSIVAVVICIVLGRLIATQVVVPALKDSKTSGSSTQQITTIGTSATKEDSEKSEKDQQKSSSASKTETKKETKKDDTSTVSSAPESTKTRAEASYLPLIDNPNSQWWGGKTDTDALVYYVENGDMQQALFFSSSGSTISWVDGPFEKDGSTVSIDYGTPNGSKGTYTFTMVSQDDDYITIETDDYGSATLPALNEDQRTTVHDAIINIDNA